jgi:uncharacterized protein (DUF58 family)
MSDYLQPDLLARAAALGIKAREIVEGLRVGDHRSPYRGFSTEFVEHRAYTPGDDPRHVDWKVYARSERFSVRQQQQETNFTGHLVLDASRSMAYGEGPANKLEYAKVLAATLACLLLHRRNGVRVAAFDSAWRVPVPAGGGALEPILEFLARLAPDGETALGPLLHELAESVPRRGVVFVVSDLFIDPAAFLGGLRHLRYQGHEVVVFHVTHADEASLPFRGAVRFIGLEGASNVMAQADQVRDAYARAFAAHVADLEQGCQALRCDYVRLSTERPLAETLPEYLARRGR